MNTPESQTIVARFFEGLDLLVSRGVLKVQTFTKEYGINYGNFYQLRKDPSRDIFQPAWLAILVTDFGFSPRWLLTGEGTPIKDAKIANLRPLWAAKRKAKRAENKRLKAVKKAHPEQDPPTNSA